MKKENFRCRSKRCEVNEGEVVDGGVDVATIEVKCVNVEHGCMCGNVKTKCEKERMSKLFVLGIEISGTVQKKWNRNVFVVCKNFKIV